MRTDGKTKDGLGELFGKRKGGQMGVGVGAGEVGRDRIMNQGADTSLGEELLKLITLRVTDDIEMPDGICPGGNEWKSK